VIGRVQVKADILRDGIWGINDAANVIIKFPRVDDEEIKLEILPSSSGLNGEPSDQKGQALWLESNRDAVAAPFCA
jgi:hypothetical protein